MCDHGCGAFIIVCTRNRHRSCRWHHAGPHRIPHPASGWRSVGAAGRLGMWGLQRTHLRHSRCILRIACWPLLGEKCALLGNIRTPACSLFPSPVLLGLCVKHRYPTVSEGWHLVNWALCGRADIWAARQKRTWCWRGAN